MKKKYHKLALVGLFSLVALFSQAQNPTFEWAKQMGGASSEVGLSIITDDRGNIYSTGIFWGIADFDPDTGTMNLTSSGGQDVFIQKIDANGNLVWAKSVGGTSVEYGYSINIDDFGNILVTGNFRGTVDFDPGIGVVNLASSGYSDIFILKLDPNGNFKWAKSMGGTSYEEGKSILTDAKSNIYTTGSFVGEVDFDPGAGITLLTSAGNYDVFLQKLDSNGNFIWAHRMGGTSDDHASSMAMDANDNIFLTGSFGGTADFNPGAGSALLTSNGNTDIFIQKLDSNGNHLWVKGVGGTTYDIGHSCAVDTDGNVYSTGYFQNTVDFDPDTSNFTLSSTGDRDIFIQKLNSKGDFVWAKRMGSYDREEGNSITTDNNGNIYTTGFFQKRVDFDPGVGSSELYFSNAYNIFIQKLDSNGDFLWVQGMGGADYDIGHSVNTDPNGNVYTIGKFVGTVDFDPGTSTTNLISKGSGDVFIQKLSQCAKTFGADVITACDSFTWINGKTYMASNTTAKDTITNEAGCDSIITLDLTINKVSDISTTVNASTITATNPNATYVWLNCDQNFSPIAGETNQSFTATTNGSYAVELTENNCVDTSACVAVYPVGLAHPFLAEQVNVYPNPTDGKFNIQFKNSQETITVRILSPIGQEIVSKKLQNSSIFELEINQPDGIYFLEIIDHQNKRTILKVIKK